MLAVMALKRVEGFLWSGTFRTRSVEHVPAKQGILVEISGLSFTPYVSALNRLYPLRKYREKEVEKALS